MADGFNAVDIIYNVLAPSGVTRYKDKAPRDCGYTEYIVVNMTTSGPSSQVTNDASVNVNIYLKEMANGMYNRTRFVAIKDQVNALIMSASPAGYYFSVDEGFSGFIDGARKGYDCLSLRFVITLNK